MGLKLPSAHNEDFEDFFFDTFLIGVYR